MNKTSRALTRGAILLGAAFLAVPSLLAQQLTWTGGGSGTGNFLNTAANWSENAAPGATNDLYISNNPGSGSTIPTLLLGANYTVRSFIFDNSASRYNSSLGLRIVSTTSSSSSQARVLTLGTAGTIITANNNANVSFMSASLSGNSTGSPLPAFTINLSYTGTGIIDVQDTSRVQMGDGSFNTSGALISGTGGIQKTGTGTLKLNGSHTFSGGFELSAGSVEMTSGSSRTGSTVTSGPLGTGTVTLSGGSLLGTTNLSERTIHNPITLNGSVALFTTSTGGTLTISALADKTSTLASDSTLQVGGTVVWNQTISGAHSLTKTGAGTLRLNGANSYTGVTTVSAGSLELNGSLAGGLNVANGATLIGSGTVNGDAVIAGAHNPGNSPGIQSFGGDLTYSAGATVNWELNANTATQGDPTAIFDQINVADTLNFAGATTLNLAFDAAGSTVNWNDAFWTSNQSWKIYDSAAVTNFGNLSLTVSDWADGSGNLFNTVLAGSTFGLSLVGGDVYVNYSVIPEPSTYAALLGLVGLAFVAYRRRSRQS